jgi:parallel beta-helix repeat protein
MKKTAVITALFMITLVIISIQPINAQYQGNITINADGSISPSTAPIQQTSSVYSLISDIAGSITVNTSNIILEGSGHTVSGISLRGTLNVTVKNFVVTMKNEFTETIGMSLDNASNNLIVNNTVAGFWSIQALNGILFAGIHVVGGNSNTISQNNVMYNLDGMDFVNTSYNLIVQNNITSNPIWSPYTSVICFIGASNNTIHHNNFVNSTYQAKVRNSINIWDGGHLGNYWSDYQTKYPNASMIENSGIGNTPYYVDAQNKDSYPLMEPFHAVPPVESSPTPTPTSSIASAPEDFPTATVATVLAVSFVVIVAGFVVYSKKRTTKRN